LSGLWRTLGLGLVLSLGVLWALSGDRSSAPADVGAPAPVFRLPDLEGAEVGLADFRGQVVLVNFWATWCKPCEDEMPAMERLYQDLSPEGFELLAVSVDAGIEEVRAFQERLRLSFPILHDGDKEASDRYQSSRYPESFLVDRDGTLVARFIGPREWDTPAYRDRVARLIRSDPAVTAEPAAPAGSP
jgi:peroxiredoxin